METINKKRFWENFSSYEFSNNDLEKFVAVLPVAAIEQHGPHLPVSVDTTIIDGIINLISKKLPENSKVIFLPTQKIGKSNEHLRYPGTLSLSSETLISTLIEIGTCVAKTGIKKIVLFNSHGGNISVLDLVARELRVRNDMLVFNLNWFGLGMPNGIYSEDELKYGIHAGDLETSIMLALDPNNVNMKRAKKFISKNMQIEKDYKHIGLTSSVKFGWQSQDLNASGACGDAKAASGRKGKVTLEFVCKKLLEVFKEIEAVPMNLISNKTK